MISINDLFTGLALVLSAISLWWQWWDRRRRLSISAEVIQKLLPVTDPPDIVRKTIPILSIYISNPGRVPIYVRDIWFELATGREFQLFKYHVMYSGLFCPFVVEPLRGHEFDVHTEGLIKELEILGCFENVVGYVKARDELGKHFRSKEVRFAVSDLRPAETDAAQPAS